MRRLDLTLLLASLAIGAVALVPAFSSTEAEATSSSRGPQIGPQIAIPEAASASALGLQVRAATDMGLLDMQGEYERYLVVELAGDQAAVSDGPVHVALVMDRSGSMSGRRMIEARKAAGSIVDQLDRETDTIAVVPFNARAAVWHASSAPSLQALGAIERIEAGGSTNIYDGVAAGCAELGRQRGNRRVLVLSDGQATAGITSMDGLAQVARQCQRNGVTVSAIGLDSSSDLETLSTLADAGGGDWSYAPDAYGIAGLFQQELHNTRAVAARDVQVALDLVPGVELLDVYGYEGWDGRRTATGHHALVGDVPGGKTRKVVARVRVPESLAGVQALGRATVSWSAADGPAAVELPFTVGWSDDIALLEGSSRTWAGEHVVRARAGLAMNEGESWSRSGELERAQASVRAGQGELKKLGALYGLEVDEYSESMNAQEQRWSRVVPGSDEALDGSAVEALRALGYME